jgi:hypothetical protein
MQVCSDCDVPSLHVRWNVSRGKARIGTWSDDRGLHCGKKKKKKKALVENPCAKRYPGLDILVRKEMKNQENKKNLKIEKN